MPVQEHIPAISVLMPVYNGEKYLHEAIDSILAQTFTDFEFIIVDDGSTDATPRILEEYVQNDSRIRVLTNETNCKLAPSLNIALAAAKAPLIARMDADDWSYPQRFEQQFLFMQEHPETSVLGSSVTFAGTQGGYYPFTENNEIRAFMLFGNPMLHPTILMKKQILHDIQGYNSNFEVAQDYALWANLAKNKAVVFSNLPQPLVRYRERNDTPFSTYRKKQKEKTALVIKQVLHDFYPHDIDWDWESHIFLAGLSNKRDVAKKELSSWCLRLQSINNECKIYEQKALEIVCRKVLLEASIGLMPVPALFKRCLPRGLKSVLKKYLLHQRLV